MQIWQSEGLPPASPTVEREVLRTIWQTAAHAQLGRAWSPVVPSVVTQQYGTFCSFFRALTPYRTTSLVKLLILPLIGAPILVPVAETELPIDFLTKSVMGYITRMYPNYIWWQGARPVIPSLLQDWHIVGLCNACGQMSQSLSPPPLALVFVLQAVKIRKRPRVFLHG